MRRVATLALFVAGFACSARERVWVGLPADSGDQTAIVAVLSNDRTVIEALDLRSAPRVELDLGPNESGRLEWLGYDEELEDLQLTVGPVPRADEGAPSTPLPTPRVSYHAVFDREGTSGWTSGEVSETLANFRIASSQRCSDFESSVVELTAESHVRFVLPIDDEVAILGTQDAHAYRYENVVATEITMTPTVAISGGFIDDSGTAWALSKTGGIYRATYDQGALVLDEVTRTPTVSEVRWADGGDIDGGIELFVVNYTGQFYSFDGTAWRTLEERLPSAKGGVVRLGPNEAVAGTGTATTLLHFDGDEITTEPVANDGITMVQRAGARGVYVSVGQGAMFRRTDDGVIVALGESAIHLDVYCIRETATGFLYGGAVGFVGEYVDGVGFCPAQQLAGGSVRAIYPIGGGYLITGDRRDVDRMPVISFIKAVRGIGQ